MQILFTRFPLESRFGGAERQTLSLMKGLQKRGYDVSFLGSCPVLLREVKELGIRNKELGIGIPPVTKLGAIGFLWRQLGMKRKLINHASIQFARHPELAEGDMQITQHNTCILMLSLSEKLLLTKWAHNRGIKVFWIEHDTVGRWLTKNPWLPRLKRLHKLATTITVSELSREIYIGLGWDPARVIAIPNGVDTEQFAPLATKRKEPDFPHLRIGCIARLAKDKGVDVLIEAVKDIPNVFLTILGTGPEKNKLKQLTIHYSLFTIHFLDSIDSITDFYSSIDLLILPSTQNDPFGLVVAEAMASGIPSICTDACGIARHMNDLEMIVPAQDTKALRKCIERFQKPETWKTQAQSAASYAQKHFSLERMIHVYDSVLRAK